MMFKSSALRWSGRAQLEQAHCLAANPGNQVTHLITRAGLLTSLLQGYNPPAPHAQQSIAVQPNSRQTTSDLTTDSHFSYPHYGKSHK